MPTILDWIGSVGVIVTILTTVTGATWWLQKKFLLIDKNFLELDNRYNELENRIDNRHNELENRINNRHNELGNRIDNKYNELENQIDNKYNELGNRINNTNKFMEVLTIIIKDMLKVNETIMSALIHSKLILPDEQVTLYKSYSRGHINILEEGIKVGAVKSNPVTKEEGDRLLKYTHMCVAGERFTIEQAEDFHRLVHELEDCIEVHRNGGYGALLSLATLVLGATLNLDAQDRRQKEVMSKN